MTDAKIDFTQKTLNIFVNVTQKVFNFITDYTQSSFNVFIKEPDITDVFVAFEDGYIVTFEDDANLIYE